MNKFEKLIEYIINDEDQKARELFHDIVVEKSRDIYESIMDEESMEETVAGNQVEDMVDEISGEEAMGEADEEGEELELGGDDEADDEFGGDEPAGDEAGEHAEIEDQVMNIDAKLDELLAKFDEIMGDEGHGDEMGAEEPMGQEDPMGAEQPEQFAEAEETSGKSGKSGSGKEEVAEGEQPEWLKKGSGKSGSGTSAASGKSGKSGSGKTEGKKSTSELMREYVDRIGDIYGGAGDAAEGDAVGAAGKKVAVNTKYTGQQTGPDFGGNAVKTSTKAENQDGTSPTKANNEYTKGQGETPEAKQNVNVPGGTAGKTAFKHKEGEYSTEHGKEGKLAGADGSRPINAKSVQKQNTGKK